MSRKDEAARTRALEFADRVRDNDEPCVNGHFGCSDVEGGQCLDETFSDLGLDNDGEWLAEDDEQANDVDNRQYAAQYAYACGYHD